MFTFEQFNNAAQEQRGTTGMSSFIKNNPVKINGLNVQLIGELHNGLPDHTWGESAEKADFVLPENAGFSGSRGEDFIDELYYCILQ